MNENQTLGVRKMSEKMNVVFPSFKDWKVGRIRDYAMRKGNAQSKVFDIEQEIRYLQDDLDEAKRKLKQITNGKETFMSKETYDECVIHARLNAERSGDNFRVDGGGQQ